MRREGAGERESARDGEKKANKVEKLRRKRKGDLLLGKKKE